MKTIQIKNVGPLKDTGEIALNRLMLVIGKKSSGKAKKFLESLMTFHRFNPDFSRQTVIKYDGDCITIEQNGDETDAVITRKESFEDRRYNTKLSTGRSVYTNKELRARIIAQSFPSNKSNPIMEKAKIEFRQKYHCDLRGMKNGQQDSI